MHPEFSGKQAIVTGAFSGIGAAVAHELSARGCMVWAAGLPGPETRGDGGHPNLEYVVLDVTNPENIEALFERVTKLDILVNCAGIIRRDDEFSLDIFTEVVDVNLVGTMRMCVAARPHLASARGCVVNTASMLAFFGGPRVPAYSASKGGIAQLTRSLAVAWAEDAIRVNAVAPGWVDTPLTRPLQTDASRSNAILQRTPMRRWGRPEEIARAAMFLCSEAASFVTGAILPVDGGYSAA